ncbi:dentin matrix acidic phosphoprotein 1-like [Mercenaria mercenaria]|uniref:dentin matrix acidic phosphoprotein 1-like n=1 Tax=Mercenaria mercenaria TaxID=6596 RepID=UPI00234F8310|nr:dentin matrix acidic phosphoprotein 1-like [Mercenaria mercenaria]
MAKTGTGSGEEKSCPGEAQTKDLTEAKGTGDSSGSNIPDLTVQTDAQNNNQEKVAEEIFVTNDSEGNLNLASQATEDNSLDADAEADNVEDTCDTVIETEDSTSKEKLELVTQIENTEECHDSEGDQQNVTEENDSVLTDASKEADNIKDNIITEEVIKPEKTHVSTFLSKTYFDEGSILKFGSVDFADDAHIQLEILHEKTKGKSWEDELKETAEAQETDLTEEEGIIEGDHLKETSVNQVEVTSFHPTIENDVSLETVDTDTKSDEHAEDKLNQDCLPEESLQSNIRVDEESTEVAVENKFIKETSVQEYSENFTGVSKIEHNDLDTCELTDTTAFKETKDILDGFEENIDKLEGIKESTDELKSIKESTDKPDGIKESADKPDDIKESTDKPDDIKETVDETNVSVTEESNCESKNHTDNSEYDADTSDSETEEIERTNKVKAALLSCLKGKRETFERGDIDNTNSESEATEHLHSVRQEALDTFTKIENGKTPDIETNLKDKPEISVEEIVELESVKQSNNTLSMPETRDNIDGCVSPSMMFASCRYRWERTILTQAPSVVFVTLNNKEIEPIKLEWSESSRCFYSEEIKVPVGVYIGNLVIDGTFYPVEDVVVKHYTFEVDLYLKDGEKIQVDFL